MIDCIAAECLQRHFPYQTVNSVHVHAKVLHGHEQTDSLIRQALMSITNPNPIIKNTEVMCLCRFATYHLPQNSPTFP